MKRFIKTISAILIIMILSTITVFGAYSATEEDIMNALRISPLSSISFCQSIRENNCGTYTNVSRTHISLGCTENGSKASTTVCFDFGTGKNCYADVAVFNTNGVNAVSDYKYGSNLLTTATASVKVSGIDIMDVLHDGYNPYMCSGGQHNYFAYK